MTKDVWVRQEIRSPLHFLAVGGLFLLLVLATVGILQGRMVWAAYGVFFLVTAWPLLKVMILITLLLSVLVAAFPPLAPFVLGLMVLFFLLRIRFVWRHRWPMFFGLIFYGLGVCLGIDAEPLRMIAFWLWRETELPSALWLGAAVNGGIGAFFLHEMLRFLYGRGYSAGSVLGLMGSVPLILLAFILPFLKIAGAEGLFGDVVTFHSAPVGGHAVPAGEDVVVDHAPPSDVPLHHVDGYVRSGPSGPVYVQSHWQTNPDSIIENNLSYHDISLPTENPPASAGTVPVKMEIPAEAAGGVYPGDVEERKKKEESSGVR